MSEVIKINMYDIKDAYAARTSHTHTKNQISDFPALANIATSGSYNDLSNKPGTITN